MMELWVVMVLFLTTSGIALMGFIIDFLLMPDRHLRMVDKSMWRGHPVFKFLTYPARIILSVYAFPITMICLFIGYWLWWKQFGIVAVAVVMVLHASLYASTEWEAGP